MKTTQIVNTKSILSEFTSYIFELIEQEKSIEILRKVLCKIENFCPKNLFNKITQGKSHICKNELKAFIEFNDPQFCVCDSDIDIVLKFYDTGGFGYFTCKDFENFCLSQGFSFVLRNVQKNESQNDKKVIYAFLKIIEKSITYHRTNLKTFRELFAIGNQQVISYIYSAIDLSKKGQLCVNDYKLFLAKAKIFDVNEVDLLPLFNRIMPSTHQMTYDIFNLKFFDVYSNMHSSKLEIDIDSLFSNHTVYKIKANIPNEQFFSTENNDKKKTVSLKKPKIEAEIFSEQQYFKNATEVHTTCGKKKKDEKILASLLQFFNILAEREAQAEHIRIKLALRYDISLSGLYEFFGGEISGIQLEKFLNFVSEKLFPKSEGCSEEDLQYLTAIFIQHDRNHDGKMEYLEFCEMFCPQASIHYSKLFRERGSSCAERELRGNELPFSFEMRLILIKLFRVVIDNERKYQEYIQEERMNQISIYDMYEQLSNEGVVTLRKLKDLFREKNINMRSCEIDLVFNYIDRDKDLRIDFNDFFSCFSYKLSHMVYS